MTGEPTVRVLMVSHPLPDALHPGTMAPAARQMRSLAEAGVEVEVVQVRGLPKAKYLQTRARMMRLLPGVDLVHAHFGYCGWLALSQRQRPVVISYMGDDLLGTPRASGRTTLWSRLQVQINRRLARRYAAVIVKSAEMARVVAPTPAHVVPNGVDLQVFAPVARLAACRRLGWDPDGIHVLFPGNPRNPRKGYPLACGAVAHASRLLGAPVEIRVLSGVDPERVPLYMNACHAVLLTSLVEGSPNVVKESLACGVPVVSVPVGDVPELLAGVHPGAVRPYRAEELGAALAELLACGPRSNGRQVLRERRLDLAGVASRILEIYAQALGRQRSGPQAVGADSPGHAHAGGGAQSAVTLATPRG
ncbi:MAG: glycosyltransferase [Candidatus Latescibacterota bacterium]